MTKKEAIDSTTPNSPAPECECRYYEPCRNPAGDALIIERRLYPTRVILCPKHAAAPAMYEALMAIAALCDDEGLEAIDLACAALKAAEGKGEVS